MQKKLSLAAIAGALLFALPALADDTTAPTGAPSAQQQCRTERTQMGTDKFRDAYGTNKNKRLGPHSRSIADRRRATRKRLDERDDQPIR